MFGKYLNIIKLVFIRTNLSIKPILRKTYFISSHFALIFSFSIDLVNHPLPLSTNIYRYCLPPTATTIRLVHHRLWLPLAIIHCYYQQSSATIHCHRLLPPVAIVCHCSPLSPATVRPSLPPFVSSAYHLLLPNCHHRPPFAILVF